MVVKFTVLGRIPSKSNFRYSAKSAKSRLAWRAIKDYEHTVGLAAMTAGAKFGRKPQPIALQVTLVNQTLDIDNALKVALDGMKNVVVPDDSPHWIPDVRVLWEKTKDGEPRVRYNIRYLKCPEDQA